MEDSKQINSKLFDEYLVDFQQDIRRIVGKFKKSFHAFSDEEIYSECNLSLLKNKEKILNSFPEDQEFNQSEFNKIAYHYVKNEVVWTHYRFMNKSYVKRRADGIIETEEGPKTTFEAILETEGEENAQIDNDNLFLESNSKHFFHVLTKYCYLLTEKECTVLSYIQKGVIQDDIAEKLNVTHQAISAMFVGIQNKLKQFFDFDEVIMGGDHTSITKGQKCMNNFFDQGISDPAITSKDKKKIKHFILNNPKKYSGKQINKILFSSKYSGYKIQGAIRSLKLTALTTSKNRPFTEEQRSNMLKLFKSGKNSQQVAESMGISPNSAQRVRGEFVKKQQLHPAKKNVERHIQ